VVQEAAINAFRAIGSFRREASFTPWFLRIVVNSALNRHRSQQRYEALQLRDAARASAAPPAADEVVIERLEQERVLAALAGLPAADRAVIALRHIDQLSEAETAVVLGCPVGTVKSRLSRAMTRLRTALADEEVEA
jgi:RNA polymerase sigma factor (sigma-70 family)